jgi:hypothetical protein
MKSKWLSFAYAFLLALMTVQNVSASWYAGNRRTSTYGGKANIWAPSSAPYIASGGESNWVSLPATPYWLQTGWNYYKGWSSAKRYVEYYLPNGTYNLVYHGTHAWGGIIEYKVEHIGGSTWCAYIAGSNKNCSQVASAPREIQAFSEVHDSNSNVLNTRFSAAYYKTSAGIWQLFNQANWREDAPYHVQKDQLYYYRNYGP